MVDYLGDNMQKLMTYEEWKANEKKHGKKISKKEYLVRRALSALISGTKRGIIESKPLIKKAIKAAENAGENAEDARAFAHMHSKFEDN